MKSSHSLSSFTIAFIGLSALTQVAYNALSFSAVHYDIIEAYNSLYVSIPIGISVFILAVTFWLKTKTVFPAWQNGVVLFLGALSWLDPSLFSLILAVFLIHILYNKKIDEPMVPAKANPSSKDLLDQLP